MTQAQPRIGVFGGAFDPPHVAHVALARVALAQLALDELRIFPTGEAWHKSRRLSAATHRLAMARLAFEGLDRVHVDAREIERVGPTYTVDTLRALQADHPGPLLFLILGEDQARALPTWREWQEILGLAIICVAARHSAVDHVDELNSFSGFVGGATGRFQRLTLEPMDVGSTRIRALTAASDVIAPLVPESVARYISHHHLYQNP